MSRALASLAFALLLGTLGATALTPAHRVNVTVIRHTSSLHSSIGNRDEYVVRVILKTGSTFTAKMIDEYPGYADALPFTSLRDGVPFSTALRRMPSCDGGLIRAEDGDSEQSLRCFEVVHGSWRLPKGTLEDQWWR
jgi:hypothetical protein